MGELTAEELVDKLTAIVGELDNTKEAGEALLKTLKDERGRILFLVWDDPDNLPFDPPVLIFARVLPDDDEPNEEANNAR